MMDCGLFKFKMASKEEIAEEKCPENTENDALKRPTINDNVNTNTDKDTGLFNNETISSKYDCASEDEFEDAVEDLTENVERNTNIEENLSEKADSHRSDDEDTYLEPSEPLTEEQKSVCFLYNLTSFPVFFYSSRTAFTQASYGIHYRDSTGLI